MRVSQLRKAKNGYSAARFLELFGKDYELIALPGGGLTPAHGFDKEAGKSTKEVVGQYMDTYFVGKGTQRVKFPTDFNCDSIKELSEIKLINPTACTVNGNILVKADGVNA